MYYYTYCSVGVYMQLTKIIGYTYGNVMFIDDVYMLFTYIVLMIQ